MKTETQIWCPTDLPITGFTLTLADAHTLRASLAQGLKNFEQALPQLPEGSDTRQSIEEAIPNMRKHIASLDAAIFNSKRAYAKRQLAKPE